MSLCRIPSQVRRQITANDARLAWDFSHGKRRHHNAFAADNKLIYGLNAVRIDRSTIFSSLLVSKYFKGLRKIKNKIQRWEEEMKWKILSPNNDDSEKISQSTINVICFSSRPKREAKKQKSITLTERNESIDSEMNNLLFWCERRASKENEKKVTPFVVVFSRCIVFSFIFHWQWLLL